MMNIRTAQAPARQHASLRQIREDYPDRIAPQEGNPLREILAGGDDEIPADDGWRVLMRKEPEAAMGGGGFGGGLRELLGKLGRTSGPLPRF